MKYSKQRELILEAVQNNPIHPTADEVYTLLKPENPSLSLGTVYRNLNLLSEMGQIRKIKLANASDRFDGRVCEHYHMICNQCGTVYDLDLALFQDLTDQILAQTGFQPQDHEFVVHGICESCRNHRDSFGMSR